MLGFNKIIKITTIYKNYKEFYLYLTYLFLHSFITLIFLYSYLIVIYILYNTYINKESPPAHRES